MLRISLKLYTCIGTQSRDFGEEGVEVSISVMNFYLVIHNLIRLLPVISRSLLVTKILTQPTTIVQTCGVLALQLLRWPSPNLLFATCTP